MAATTLTGNQSKVHKLVRGFSDSLSTADFIIFIAGDKERLSLCRTFVDQVDHGEATGLVHNVREVCTKEGVQSSALYADIKNVLQALHLHNGSHQDDYATLGLDPSSTQDEVKRAYRKLSIQYHPDRAGQDSNDRFIAICNAYHALADKDGGYRSSPKASWRKGRRIRNNNQTIRFIITVTALIIGLIILSIIYTWRYQQKVYLQQAQEFVMSPSVNGDDKMYKKAVKKCRLLSGNFCRTNNDQPETHHIAEHHI